MNQPVIEPSQGALSHLRVIEYGDIPASYATRWLGDLGADIIKIEKPGGDNSRMLGPFAGNTPDPEKSLTFINANLNKRSIILDLESSEKDKETFLKLISSADALVESTRPGTFDDLGLSQKVLLATNERLVTTSITPFGQTGPYSAYRGPHAVVEALAGFMSAHGDDMMPPVVTPNHITYQVASVHGAYLTLAGIRHSKRSGKGQQIDQSLQESITYMGSSAVARYTDRITFILDSDEAGTKSVQRIYSKYISRGIRLRFLKVPDSYKDVDEYFSDSSKNKHTFAREFKQIIPETW